MKEPKDILTKEFLEEHYINQRKSVGTIAKEQGIKSKHSVWQALKRHGLSRRSLKDSSHILTKEYLEEHYVRQNKSQATIVNEIGFKRKSIVRKALIKHNIPIREHTRSEKLEEAMKAKRIHHTIRKNYFSSLVCSAEKRGYAFEVTIDEIWEIFEKQEGRCAISGLPIVFNGYGENKNTQTASLDRIDSSKGYVLDNVQWLHKSVNLMKLDMTQQDFIDFCETIYFYNKEKA